MKMLGLPYVPLTSLSPRNSFFLCKLQMKTFSFSVTHKKITQIFLDAHCVDQITSIVLCLLLFPCSQRDLQSLQVPFHFDL